MSGLDLSCTPKCGVRSKRSAADFDLRQFSMLMSVYVDLTVLLAALYTSSPQDVYYTEILFEVVNSSIKQFKLNFIRYGSVGKSVQSRF